MLIKHLKITGHQPSGFIDKRNVFSDYKQCYTCKEEFENYNSLMLHRKKVHPSNKKCRNFPTSCTFNKDCWYVHGEPMEIDPVTQNSFHCDICDEVFSARNDFMKHKRTKHEEKVNTCDKFLKGECPRREELCWYRHLAKDSELKSSQKQVFQKIQNNSVPPDQLTKVLHLMTTLCTKVENLEKRFQVLLE